jgi:hypothetical protein
MTDGINKSLRLKEDDIDKLLKASDDLMKTGIVFSGNIDTALQEFKTAFELSLKTHFMATAVVEMLAQSFEKLEEKVQSNLEGINNICTEGGQWYSFYLGMALGRAVSLPSIATETSADKAQAKAAS